MSSMKLQSRVLLIPVKNAYDILTAIVRWITDFPMDREQKVKLGGYCLSEWKTVPARVSQGPNWATGYFLL